MKKIIITLTIIFSSFLFINKTSALTTDDGYNYVYFNYDYDFVSSSVKSAYFNNIISDIKTKFESSAYDKYIIYFDDNNYVHAHPLNIVEIYLMPVSNTILYQLYNNYAFLVFLDYFHFI